MSTAAEGPPPVYDEPQPGGEEEEVNIEQGSMTSTVANSVCNIVGAGVLSLPMAYCHGSIVLTTAFILFGGICAAFCAQVICVAAEVDNRFSYAEIVAFQMFPLRRGSDSASGSRRVQRVLCRIAVNLICSAFNFGALIAYSRIVMNAMPPVVHEFLNGSGFLVNSYFWLSVSSILFFALTCTRKMHELTWTSIMGVATIVYVIVCIIIRFFTGVPPDFVPMEKQIRVFELSMEAFRGVGAVTLAYAYHYNVPLFYREMHQRSPRRFLRSICISTAIATCCYLATGLLGYLIFGQYVLRGGNIVDNFPSDDTLLNIGRLGLFAHFVAVYPVISVNLRRTLHDSLAQGLKLLGFDRAYASLNGEFRQNDVEMTTAPSGQPPSAPVHHPKRELGDAPRAESESFGGLPIDEGTTPLQDEGDNLSIATDEAQSWKIPRKCIVTEAFCIVLSASLIAAFAPGIGDVIATTGTMFGTLILFVIPGIVGANVFRPVSLRDANSLTFTGSSALYAGSLVCVAFGAMCWVLGVVALFSPN